MYGMAMLEKERQKAGFGVQGINRSGRREDRTGIPTQLKERMEQSAGLSFDDVRVHYNSDLPARLNASTYTKGNRVEIGPRQERHLPHEANVTGTKAVQLSENKDNDKLIDKRIEGGVIQAKLPDDVDWKLVYEKFNNKVEIESGRTIGDSERLIKKLDLTDDYGSSLEDEDNGIRRLAYDLSLVVDKVKIIIKNKINGFSETDLRSLRKARVAIMNLVKTTEGAVYGTLPEYINEETPDGFKKRKKEASTMINAVLGRDNIFLSVYFKEDPSNTDFYKKVRANYRKIREYLGYDDIGNKNAKVNFIGFTNNFTALPDIYAYVHSNDEQHKTRTMVGTKDVNGTYINTEKNSKGKATGFNIRLSSAYRKAPNNGTTDTKAGTIIHETSHLILGTEDCAYGESEIIKLNKDEAIKNADTYEIAAEKV